MQASDFTGDMPGEFIRTLDGHYAFLPNPLPPVLAWSNDFVNLLSEADRALGRLAGLGTEETTGQKRSRVYLATGVVNKLDAPAEK